MLPSPEIKKKPKILVYLFGSLGDTIVAIPGLRAIRRHFQEAEIVLLQNFQSGAIVRASEVVPEHLVDRFLSYDSEIKGISKVLGYYQLWKDLRRERFDSAIYLVISERPARSVLRDRQFFRSCGIRDLKGFQPFTNDELYPVDATGHPAMTDQEAVRKLARLERAGIPPSASEDLKQPFFTFSAAELEQMWNWLVPLRRNVDVPLIALAPGCKSEANYWPVDNFIEVARNLIADHDCEIIIVGGKSEVELGDRIVDALGAGVNAAGQLSVRDSAALLSLCKFYIGLDTGATHLAAAVDVPCFCIVGERDNPGHWFPLGTGHTIVFHSVKCAGCLSFVCPLPDHPCMNGISPAAVMPHLQNFIARNRTFGVVIPNEIVSV